MDQIGRFKYKVFFSSDKDRKQIVELTTTNGEKLVDLNEIQNEIISFYKSPMGTAATSTKAVNKSIMKQGPTLNHQQRVMLCSKMKDWPQLVMTKLHELMGIM